MQRKFGVVLLGLMAGGCSAVGPTESEIKQLEHMKLPEAQAGLVYSPTNVNYSKLESFALSGEKKKENLVERVMSAYPSTHKRYENLFKPSNVDALYRLNSIPDADDILAGPLAVMKLGVPAERFEKLEQGVSAAQEGAEQRAKMLEETLAAPSAKVPALPTQYALNYSDTSLVIELDKPKEFMFKDGFFSLNIGILPIRYYTIEDGEKDYGTADYFLLNGKPSKVKVTVEKAGKPLPQPYNKYHWSIDIPGLYHYRISAAGQSIAIPFEVEELAIRADASVDALISAYGLPSQKETYYAEWPCTVWANGKPYAAAAYPGVLKFSHWAYAEKPYLVFEVFGDTVTGLFVSRETALDDYARDECRS